MTAYDKQGRDIAYNEYEIQPMSDGTSVAVTRTEWRSFGVGHVACGSVCFSNDRGLHHLQ